MKARQRFLLGLIGATVACAILVALGSIGLVRSVVRERFVERIRAETSLLAEHLGVVSAASAQAFAVRSAGSLGTRVTLIDEQGTVLADSATDRTSIGRMDNHIDRPEIAAARLHGSGDSFRKSATTDVEYFYSACLVPGVEWAGYVRIALPSSRIYETQARYAWLVVLIAFGAALPLTAISFAVVHRLSRPLEGMTDAVERVAAGEFDLKLPVYRGEELSRLAAATRRMRQALLQKISELDGERALLSSVIAGMQEGLILVGSDRTIRLANRAAREIFELADDPAGTLLSEGVRHPVLTESIERAFEQPTAVTGSVMRMESSGRIFTLYVTPLARPGIAAGDELLVLLFDVTRLETLERVRREFVANVSHELRTPLTSIKAAAETLQETGIDDPVHATRFLDIIRRQTDRMGALVSDLTDLSRIESGAISLDIESIEAAAVARDVAEQLGPLAVRLGVELRTEVAADLRLNTDRRRLEQMLTNLVENALKFNKPGGHVTIRSSRGAAGALLILVEDAGIGLSGEDQEKVFHRFYQVDEGRTSGVGGTGLGLAIVKHLMRLHGGHVRVESELGRGATFTLEFPG